MRNPVLIVILLLLTISCDKVEREFLTVRYHVSGQVVDKDGNGIEGIIITTDSGLETVTGNFGDFFLDALSDVTTISAISDEYNFLPSEFVVSTMRTDLKFQAKRIPTENEQQIINWFNQQQLPNGLLESTEDGNLVSLYDNALAALVFMSYNDFERAEKIFDFFKDRINTELTVGNGGFSQFRDRNGVPNNHRWMGDNAWLLMALNNYEALTGSQEYQTLSIQLRNWLVGLQDTDGGLFGGFDANENQIHKITEGNIDAFNAVKGFTSFHEQLLTFLENDRWDVTDQNLVSWPGNSQYYYAMDLHPWGFCIFDGFPISTLASADRYKTTQIATINGEEITGYCFDIDNDVVWSEGTGQMVVAFNFAGMETEANYYLHQLEKMITPSTKYPNASAIPYASNMGTSYGNGQLWQGVDTNPAISACAWYLFGKNKFNPFEVQYHKVYSSADFMFWL